MIVRELIEQLSKLDPALMVLVSGYEGGFDELQTVSYTTVKRDPRHESYWGEYDEEEDGFEAILLPR